MRIALIFCAWLLCSAAVAVPNEPATLDRSTWPEQLNSPALFDVASRAEILTFAHALLASEALDDDALKQRLNLKVINIDEIDSLRRKLWLRLLTEQKGPFRLGLRPPSPICRPIWSGVGSQMAVAGSCTLKMVPFLGP